MYAEDITADAVLAAYATGQRLFSQLALPDGADLSGCCLEGASFHECFISSITLEGANLRGTVFRDCNLKCTDFDDADLTDALIEECSIECLSAHRCKIEGLQVRNCACHSSTDLGLKDFIELAVNFPDS
jgi:uncharacterized protein YjbI with pentapeptide repeats